MSSLPRQAREELLIILEEKRRRKAKSNLVEFARQIVIPGTPINDNEDCEEFYPDNVTPAKHHEIILETLEKLAKGELIAPDGMIGKNVMFLAPPGSAKSTYASVVFPTWFMGWAANSNIIMTTYGSDLASKFGRKCRAICKSLDFKKIFDSELVQGNAAADDWSLTNASTYMCGGILSGITGSRADGLIIDDPFKNREEANSDTVRKKVIDEYRDTLDTRLKPNAWRLIINTRWHEADLCGSILPKEYKGDSGWFKGTDGLWWCVLNFQAECQTDTDPLKRKRGEFLWTEWFPVVWWKQKKRTHAGYSWSSLFQGIPTPDEGVFFHRTWFKRYELGKYPEHLNTYICEDFAVTDAEDATDPDFTEHGVGGFDENDDLWFIDWWSGQTETDEWIDELIKLARLHDPLASVGEGGVIRRAVEPFLKKEMRIQKCYFRQEWIDSGKNKSAKARGFQGMAKQGKVWIPYGDWGDALIEQLVKFPSGKHDDKVDVCGLFGRILDQTFASQKNETKENNKKDVYGQIEDDEDFDDWKVS